MLALAGVSGRAAPPRAIPWAQQSSVPSAAAAPPPPLPVISGSDIPSMGSPAPSAAEWKQGHTVRPSRGSVDAGACTLTLVREWLQVRCTEVLGAGLVAGDTKGVTVHVVGQAFGQTGGPATLVATVVMPVQRGQARIVELNESVEEYDSTALGQGLTLSLVWRAGSPDPVLAAYGPPPSIAHAEATSGGVE
jgi:hypothetical protein